MPKFIPYDPNQSKMVVINYSDQLQPGTFEFAINHIIDNKLDLTVFHPRYQNDAGGRPAYDPAILLKIILFAYSKGITSSREIQWCCETNILFKALSCDTVPHYTTLASFVSGRGEEIEALFEQVLLICEQQGLLGKELFAIDGCKMSSNAAKEWSGTFKELAQKRDKIKRQIHYYIKAHKKLDSNDTREDERRQRTEQAIDTLNQAHDKQGHPPGLQRGRHGRQKAPDHCRCPGLRRRPGTPYLATCIEQSARTLQATGSKCRCVSNGRRGYSRYRLCQRSQYALSA